MASPFELGTYVLLELGRHTGPPRRLSSQEEAQVAAVLLEQLKAALTDPEKHDDLLFTVGTIVNKTSNAMTISRDMLQYVSRHESAALLAFWKDVSKGFIGL